GDVDIAEDIAQRHDLPADRAIGLDAAEADQIAAGVALNHPEVALSRDDSADPAAGVDLADQVAPTDDLAGEALSPGRHRRDAEDVAAAVGDRATEVGGDR